MSPAEPAHDEGDRDPRLSDARKTVHNETTKLQANTINAVAIAFFITGGVAPLAGAATVGISGQQILLGAIWIAIGFILHSIAQRVLRNLLP